MTDRAQGIATCTSLRSRSPCSLRRLRYSISPALPEEIQEVKRSASTRSSPTSEFDAATGATPALSKPDAVANSRSHNSSSGVQCSVCKIPYPEAEAYVSATFRIIRTLDEAV